jgi:regulator of replication initiation timing
MPSENTPQINAARARAMASIDEAFRSMGHVEPKLEQPGEPRKTTNETFKLGAAALEPVKITAEPFENPLPGRSMTRIYAGILAACVGVSIIVWHSSRGGVEREPISTAAVSLAQREGTTTSHAPKNAESAVATGPAELLAQAAAPPSVPVVSTAAPPPSELSQQIQGLAREFANVEQGLDQLKIEQSRLVSENAELTEQLKALHQIAHRNAELAEQLKAAQDQLTRDNGNLTDQLKAGRELMESIAGQLRQNQEQIAHVVVPEQKPRQRIPPPITAVSSQVAASSQATISPTRRPRAPTPTPSTAGRPAAPTSREP